MGVEYCLANEKSKQALEIDKAYWLAEYLLDDDRIGFEDVTVEKVKAAAAATSERRGAGPEEVIRWLEAQDGTVNMYSDHGPDGPWEDPDNYFQPFPDWTVVWWGDLLSPA